MFLTASAHSCEKRTRSTSLIAAGPAALTTMYRLTVRTSQGCEAVDSIRVTVHPVPPTPTIRRAGKEFYSSAAAGNQWLLNGVTLPGATAASLLATQAGEYRVMVRNAAGCESSASAPLDMPLADLIPNIITPNHDGLNDRFPVRSLGPDVWDLVIVNRWGKEVYRAAAYQDTWDAEGLPDGVYYYWLRRPRDGQQVKGWIQVVR